MEAGMVQVTDWKMRMAHTSDDEPHSRRPIAAQRYSHDHRLLERATNSNVKVYIMLCGHMPAFLFDVGRHCGSAKPASTRRRYERHKIWSHELIAHHVHIPSCPALQTGMSVIL